MAVTKTGSFQTIASYNRVAARLTLEVSFPGGAHDPTDTQCTVSWWLRAVKHGQDVNGSSVTGNDDWFVSGGDSASGNRSWSLSRPGASTIIASGSTTVSLGSSAKSFSMAGRIRDAGPSGKDLTVSASVTIPRRVYARPATPTGISATRVSDSRANLSADFAPTSTAPITRVEWGRYSDRTDEWGPLRSLSGRSESYADNTLEPSTFYRYRVRVGNVDGWSGWDYDTDTEIWTTPARSTSAPTARRDSQQRVVLTLPPVAAIADRVAIWHVEDDVLDTSAPIRTVSAGTSSTTFSDLDNTKTHAFAVSAIAPNNLQSTRSPVSNTVQLLAPPLAPVWLGPEYGAGRAVDADEDVTVQFEHLPVDSSVQTAYEWEWKQGAGLYTSSGKIASDDSSFVVPAGTWDNAAGSVTVRLFTWGAHADRSQVRQVTLSLSARPSVLINYDGSPWPSSLLELPVTFSDPEGSGMSAWRAWLMRDEDVVDEVSGLGNTDSVAFGEVVHDGADYVVRFTARDGAGLWAPETSQVVPVQYALPPTSVLEAVWDPVEGVTTLSWSTPAPEEGQAEPVAVLVQRADLGQWRTLGGGQLPTEGVVTDTITPTGTVVAFRVVTVSDLPSEAVAEPVEVDTPTKFVFLNYGPGFSRMARFWADLSVAQGYGRQKELKDAAGRPDPVEFAGSRRRRTATLSTKVFAPHRRPDLSSSFEELVAVSDAPAPVCYRDPEGLRMFVSTGDVDEADHLRKPHRPVTLPMTRVGWKE